MPEKKIIIDRHKISDRVCDLGRKITQDYAEGNLILAGVLNGSFIFTADLARAIDLPLEITFIKVASYGANTCSSGKIELVQDIDLPVAGRDILVVEDIVDTGNTIAWLKEHLARKNPGSIKFCALIDKNERREHNLMIEYSGFNIPLGFLIGYGLDYGGKYRELPDIYELLDT